MSELVLVVWFVEMKMVITWFLVGDIHELTTSKNILEESGI